MKKHIKKLLLIGLLSLGVFYVFGQSADAGYSEFPNELPDMGVSSIHMGLFDGSANGTGSTLLYSPHSWVKVYTTNPVTKTVTFDLNHDCEGRIRVESFRLNTLEKKTGALPSQLGTNLNSGCGKQVRDIPGSRFTKSDRDEHKGIWVTLLHLSYPNSDPLDGEGPKSKFKISVDGAKLGSWGMYDSGGDGYVTGNIDPGLDQRRYMQAFIGQPTSSLRDDFEIKFAPPCDLGFGSDNKKNITLHWFDDDAGTSYQGSIGFRIWERDRGSPGRGSIIKEKNHSGIGSPTSPFTGEGKNGEFSFQIKKDKKYTWEWKGVTRNNGLTIFYPFDSADFDTECKPNLPEGNLNTTCSSIRVNNIKDSDHDENKAYIKLTVENKDGPGKVTVHEGYIKGEKTYSYPSPSNTWTKRKVRLKIFNEPPGGGENYNNDGAVIREKTFNCPVDDNSCYIVKFGMPSNYYTRPNGNTVNNMRYAVWVNDWGSSGTPPTNYQSNNTYNGPISGGWDYKDQKNPGSTVTKDLRQQNKIVSGTLTWTVVKYSTYTNSKGKAKIRVYNRTTKNITSCYRASCTVDVHENVPGASSTSGAVKAGADFNVTLRIKNEGRNKLPEYLTTNTTSYALSATVRNPGSVWGSSPNGSYFQVRTGDTLFKGETSQPLTRTFRAPNDVNPRTFSAYPDYWGRGPIGVDCSHTVSTYKQFNITPTASLSMDDEDPDVIDYTTGGNNSGAPVGLAWSSILYKNATSSPLEGPIARNNSFGNVNIPDTFGTAGVPLVPGTLGLGDDVCAQATVNIGSGWVGPGNSILGGTAARTSPPSCNKITNKPYVQAYGADVVAGSNFGESCSLGTGEIKGYQSAVAGKTGSGVQFAALAMGSAVDNFRSAMLRAANPLPVKGLTISNSDAAGPYGGNYQGVKHCTTDYFGTTQDEPVDRGNPLDLVISDLPDDEQSILNGPVTISSASGTFDKSHTVYVDNDVRISSDIEYPGLGPSFTLVVKGDIYISKDVTQLDGLYIAQPIDATSGGNIYTCTPNSFGLYPEGSGRTELWDNCQKQLTVNGAFIAEDIRFLRTANSLRDSCNGEYTNNSSVYVPCGTTNASEIFNFSPELYLNSSIFGGESSNRYDHITTLPPIL